MKHGLVLPVAAATYAVVVFGVVVAPALLLARVAARGGIAPSLQALDLVAVSAVVGAGYAVVTNRRLRRQATQTRSSANVWIAALHALVVLALLASVLLAVVLHGLGPLQAPVAAGEGTLLALWGAVHVVAVVSAEVTERAVFRWLVASGADPPSRGTDRHRLATVPSPSPPPSSTESATGVEQVVLLDDTGVEVGVADKAGVHTDRTPLHLAFSCYVTDDAGRVLMTRRSLAKLTWPGVWTNAVCGHPGPGEAFEAAVHRRVAQELGGTVRDLTAVLPDFRYRAVDASGVVENEVCPVFSAVVVGALSPDPAEVAELAWARWDDVVSLARSSPWALSPWSVLQLTALAEAGWRPAHA